MGPADMWPYWLLFLFPAWMAISRFPSWQGQAMCDGGRWNLAFAGLVLMIGMRHEVGGDWANDWGVYAASTDSVSDVSLREALRLGDPAYSLLIWLVGQLGLDIYALDILSAVPFTWGLTVFCRAQPRPWLALTIAVPYLIMVVAMGYTRQSVAIGLSMLGLVSLSHGRALRFVLWMALAATFHKSAVILLPLAVLAGTRRRLFVVLWVSVATFVLFALLLQESVDRLVTNYIGAEYSSQGASIRIAMNAMPAVLFLCLRSRFVMPHSDRIFWMWMSLGAIAFIGLLVVSPSSTAVDRVALYWIPLQLFVLSRLPDAIGQTRRNRSVWVYAVVGYSAAVHFVWLVYADTAFAWLPYQFYPWVWLWQ